MSMSSRQAACVFFLSSTRVTRDVWVTYPLARVGGLGGFQKPRQFPSKNVEHGCKKNEYLRGGTKGFFEEVPNTVGENPGARSKRSCFKV
jgi:hypothetical protein